MNKIKILVVEPRKQPYIKVIRNEISQIYSLVYAPLKEMLLEKNIYILYSKEAQNRDMEDSLDVFSPNRKLSGMLLFSNFVVIGKDENMNWISLTTEEIKKYSNWFHFPNGIR